MGYGFRCALGAAERGPGGAPPGAGGAGRSYPHRTVNDDGAAMGRAGCGCGRDSNGWSRVGISSIISPRAAPTIIQMSPGNSERQLPLDQAT